MVLVVLVVTVMDMAAAVAVMGMIMMLLLFTVAVAVVVMVAGLLTTATHLPLVLVTQYGRPGYSHSVIAPRVSYTLQPLMSVAVCRRQHYISTQVTRLLAAKLRNR